MKSYESMQRDLDFRRKRMKLEAKEQDLQKTSQDNKDLEKLVRELREARNLEQAMEAAAKARESKKQLAEQVTQLREEVYYSPESRPKNERPVKKGDFVKLVAGGATGKVDSIKGDKVIVEVGLMRMTLNIRDVIFSNPTIDLRQSKSVQSDVIQRSAAFYPRIDIRGVRYEEALKMVEDFMDQALITSSNHLQIVHGKGNGTLRNAVRSKLREYQNVEMEIRHPEPEGGGDGVTLIEFK